MAYLKHIMMTGLLLSGLTEPVLFNALFNCYLMDPGPAYGHPLNPGLSNTFMTDTPLLYFEYKLYERKRDGQVSQQLNLIFKDSPDLIEVYRCPKFLRSYKKGGKSPKI